MMAPDMSALGDRPSRHGALLGEALARLAETGRQVQPELPEPCLTCAFRRGSMPNQSAGTGTIALNCVLDIDEEDFACHHGMREGHPTRICSGYRAAQLAPWSVAQDAMLALAKSLEQQHDGDEHREQFDHWAASVDPDRELDVYQLARAYAEAPPASRLNGDLA